jgi:hypothetical protein
VYAFDTRAVFVVEMYPEVHFVKKPDWVVAAIRRSAIGL